MYHPNYLTLIAGEAEWNDHKRAIDGPSARPREHYGRPGDYPCLVHSEWANDSGGSHWSHDFLYYGHVKQLFADMILAGGVDDEDLDKRLKVLLMEWKLAKQSKGV